MCEINECLYECVCVFSILNFMGSYSFLYPPTEVGYLVILLYRVRPSASAFKLLQTLFSSRSDETS